MVRIGAHASGESDEANVAFPVAEGLTRGQSQRGWTIVRQFNLANSAWLIQDVSQKMSWHFIDSQADLDAFEMSVCWEDSSSIAYFASEEDMPYYPKDVCRDGHVRKNLHLICSADSRKGKYLEIVFMQAEHVSPTFLDYPYIGGRIDTLRRVTVTDPDGRLELRCARMIFRFMEKNPRYSFIPEEERG